MKVLKITLFVPLSLRRFLNKLVQRRLVFLIMVLLLIVEQILWNFSSSPPRQKTNITFMNENLCNSSATENTNGRTAVIVVLSARNHFDNRNLIRQTYGTVRNANNVQILGVVFMLGNLDAHGSDVTDDNKLQEERNRFGDIVVGDFVDCYRNLTLKTIMAYEWITSRCREAQIVVKTDDDVFVNIFELTRELDSWSQDQVASSKIWCKVDKEEKSIDDVNSVYYASPLDFPNGFFPTHCEGVGYVTPIGVIDRIINEIWKSFPRRVCTHEDVFMTGIVPLHINSHSNYFWRKSQLIEHIVKNSWRSLSLQDGRGDEDYFLRHFIKNTSMDLEVENFIKLRKRYDKKMFFLITHSDHFKKVYLRLWEIIRKIETSPE
ncbi:beta-1,3-galactosyltransferase 5-like [Bradysia coprophila]|uniref:beta-1,3-galactosyltransferase 5-like n=1 Tax=Bradysia coprophila TaxID=38358 RepID=UPI00187DCEB6|nr:beta-1,3-galactosyltransferase 5-like [Bradysia coprophila]